MEQIGFNLIIFKEDDTELHNSFLCGSVHRYLFEYENNFIIKVDGVYYGPLKECCEVLR